MSWMINRENCGKCAGGLLLDDCGVGKTPQVIATLARNPQKTTLIVAPVNILSQWKAQLHRWLPDAKVLLYHSSGLVKVLKAIVAKCTRATRSAKTLKTMKRLEEKVYYELYRRAKTAAEESGQIHNRLYSEDDSQTDNHPLIVVTSYGKLTNREYEKQRRRFKRLGLLEASDRFKTGSTPLSLIHWDRVVLDECHLIRNHNTTRTRYVLSLNARIRWGLTATPIHNGMQDYECLLKFLGLKKWEIAHVFASHPALEKYLSEKARKEAEGKILDLSGGLNAEDDFQILSKTKPRLTHQELTLRRTKKQVFSCPNLHKRSRSDSEDSVHSDYVDDEDYHRLPHIPKKKRKLGQSSSRNAPELPELKLDIVRVDFATREEEQFYRRLEQAVRLEVFPDLQDADEVEISDQALFELILRLRQASVNPALVVSGYRRKFHGQLPTNLLGLNDTGQAAAVMTRAQRRQRMADREKEIMEAIGTPSKTRALQKMLLQHCDEKAIIFCEFREEMPLLQHDLATVGITSVLYDGSLSLAARADIVKRMSWTHAEINSVLASGQFFPHIRHVPAEIIDAVAQYVSYQVIIVQINSGNAGLNLQMCSRVYYTNPNWNPCTEIQAWGRAHRLGQTLEVGVVKLVLSGHYRDDDADDDERVTNTTTVDQRVLDVQAAKRAIMADILDDEDILFNGNEARPRTTSTCDLNTQDLLHMVGVS